MNSSDETITERRVRLAGEIARQRMELAQAYRNLEKPIHYAEYGLRGFGFLRKNPWVFAAVPAAFSIASTLFSLRKRKTPRTASVQHPTVPKSGETQKPLKIWLGRAAQ